MESKCFSTLSLNSLFKLIGINCFLFISFNSFAQPDPRSNAKYYFRTLSEEIKGNPSNYRLILKRVHLTEIDQIPNGFFKKYKRNLKEIIYPYVNAHLLLEDLNKLINNNAVIEDRLGKSYDAAYCHLLKGRLYFFMDKKDSALLEYRFAASNYDDSFYTIHGFKEKIYTCIAECYYLKNPFTSDDARATLKNLYKAYPETKIEYWKSEDYFEIEKKELLIFLNEDKQLTSYYKELAISQYEKFSQSKTKSQYTGYIYDIEQYYKTLWRIYELATRLKKTGNSQKSRKFISQLIYLLPTDNKGLTYTKFPKNHFKIWLDEYRYKTPLEEWDNRNKTDVAQHFQKLKELISSIK